MKQTASLEHVGLTPMDHQAMQSTAGGSEIGYIIGQGIGWLYMGFRAFAEGASESAHSMPGLK